MHGQNYTLFAIDGLICQTLSVTGMDKSSNFGVLLLESDSLTDLRWRARGWFGLRLGSGSARVLRAALGLIMGN